MKTEIASISTAREEIALEFVNCLFSKAGRRVPAFQNGRELLDWLREKHLAPCEVLDRLAASAEAGELDAIAGQARALGVWFRQFVVEQMGRPLPCEAVRRLSPLNQIFETDARHIQVEVDPVSPHRLINRSHRNWSSNQALLLPIADAMMDLVCRANFTHVRMCEGKDCESLFHDQTRARARRWCSMAICGNRAKQAARRNPAAISEEPAIPFELKAFRQD